MTAKKLIGIGKGTFKCFGEDKAVRLASSLAYYAMFSIGPLLVIILLLAGAIFGEDTVKQFLHQQISAMMGEKAGGTIDSMMTARHFSGSIVTTIIGIVTLVFGAAGVFGELQDALNTIWDVKAKPGAGIWAYIRNRFLSLSMVLGLGFLLLISMVLTTAAEAASNGISGMFPIPDFVVSILGAVASFVVVTLFFALLFKYLPDVKVQWRPVWIGALVTAALFTGGKFLLSLYLAKQATSSSYGAAGSVVVILLWIYYASLIMFIGVEFTKVYARETGAAITPNEYAVPADEDASGTKKKKDERPQVEVLPPKTVTPVAAVVAFAVGLGAAFGLRRRR
jgi:membrane protein